ncbi:MAG: tetratricopeptide repeat protein [Alphaproteobacteria bacterium]|nr:tetratricopeptide repeat protein [Alphaproteobacteria bacterium]
MRPSCRNFQKIIFKTLVLGIGVLSISSGLILCLMKSPQEKSEQYMQIASHLDDQLTAHIDTQAQDFLQKQKMDLIYKAIAQNPNHADLWRDLALVLAQTDDMDTAWQARNIALTLNSKINLSRDRLLAFKLTDETQKQVALSDTAFQLSFTY